MLLTIVLLFVCASATGGITDVAHGGVNSDLAAVNVGAPIQQPANSKPAPAKPEQTPAERGKGAGTNTGKANPQKEPPFRIKTKESFGRIFISVHARKARLADVAAEIG